MERHSKEIGWMIVSLERNDEIQLMKYDKDKYWYLRLIKLSSLGICAH